MPTTSEVLSEPLQACTECDEERERGLDGLRGGISSDIVTLHLNRHAESLSHHRQFHSSHLVQITDNASSNNIQY